MDVVCKGSSVKGCPGKRRARVKRRAQKAPQQDCLGLETRLGTSELELNHLNGPSSNPNHSTIP